MPNDIVPVNAEFHAERRRGIWSTDIGPLLGLSRFGYGPMDIAVSKLANVADRPSARMKIGNLLEPVIAQLWTEETGIALVKAPAAWHPQHDWIGAHGDYISVERAPRMIEIKWTNEWREWGTPGTDEVPQDILCQVQWQIACYGGAEAEVAALVCGDLKRYPIKRNDELIESMIGIAHDFWTLIQAGKVPEPDWSHPKTPELIGKLYRTRADLEISLPPAVADLVRLYETLGVTQRQAEKDRDVVKAMLTNLMGNAGIGVIEGFGEVRRKVITKKMKATPAHEREEVRLNIKRFPGSEQGLAQIEASEYTPLLTGESNDGETGIG